MSVEDRVIALINEGNPIPDPNDLDLDRLDAAAYLATLEQRSSGMTQLDSKRKEEREKKSIRPWLAAAGIIMVAGVALVLTTQADPTPVAGQPSPDVVLAEYVDARNAIDLNAVMALYADDAVVKNHPFSPPFEDDEIATGVGQIRSLELRVPGNQGLSGDFQVLDIVVTGNTVTFSHRFINIDGECFNGTGNQVTVENGMITFYDWGTEEDQSICE